MDNHFLQGTVRQLKKEEAHPIDLLLLADETVDAIAKYIHDCDIFVYEQNGAIVAQYTMQKLSPEVAEIKNISVGVPYQGRGLGKLLLTDAIARAKQNGFRSLLIGTGDVMFMQLRLYQTMGFEMHQIKKNFFLQNYAEPLFEDGLQLKHMVVLHKVLA